MMTAEATLILLLLLSTMICQGEENRVQESEDDPATEKFYFVIGIVVVITCFILQFRYPNTYRFYNLTDLHRMQVFSSFKI